MKPGNEKHQLSQWIADLKNKSPLIGDNQKNRGVELLEMRQKEFDEAEQKIKDLINSAAPTPIKKLGY